MRIFFSNISATFSHAEKKPWLIPLLFFVLNLIIKSFSITKVSYDLDESWHTFFSQKAVGEILKQAGEDPNGPLYNLLLHFWMVLFGNSEIATRSLSVLFSSLTAPLIYEFGRKHLTKQAGIFSALIFSFANLHFFYSHIARVYSLVCVLAIISMYLYLELIKTGKLKVLIYYTAVCTAMIYTHLTTVFILAAQFLAGIIFFRRSKHNILLSMVCIIASMLSFVPWAMNSYYFNKPQATSWLSPPTWKDANEIFVDFAGSAGMLYILTGIFLIAAISIVRNSSAEIRKAFLFLLFCFFVPILCSAIVSHLIVSVFLPRYVMFSSLSMYMLSGLAVSMISSHRSVRFITLLMVLIFSFSLLGKTVYTFETWKTVVNEIKKNKTDRTLIMISPTYQKYAFCYYYNREFFSRPDSTVELLKKDKVILAEKKEDMIQYPSDYDNIILLTSHETIVNPESLVKYLKNNFQMKSDTQYSGIRMYFFEKRLKLAFMTDDMEGAVQSFQPRKIIEKEFARSGKKVCLLDKSSSYSNTFEDRAGAFSNFSGLLKACGWVYHESNNINCVFVISIESDSVPYFYRSAEIKGYGTSKKWFQVCEEIQFPVEMVPTDRVKAYFWNQGETPVYIDDMEIAELK